MAKRPPLARSGRLRCAVYTRKSTEEGLEQAFNNLDAQREACAAYVLSQQHEGWSLVPDLYDDGGFSGGNMERPALRRLMTDVEAGKVDVIVVYKVDRLTRSLADFAKIVEVLDARGASFVSVTQAFNTTSSMGRLTLNVLLSFAQFEREVTGERIRDKVAASKKKGMWMGGVVPLGYDVRDRKLVINAAEAATVRMIFERYLQLGAIGPLAEELHRRSIRSKRRQLAEGTTYGDRTFSKGALAHMLKNRIYVGEVCHKGASYPGEHQPIVAAELFQQVQDQLANKRPGASSRRDAAHPSLLAGMIVDGEGRPMTPSHATKGARRYRYYVTRQDVGSRQQGWRIPAGEVEQLVVEHVARALADEAHLVGRYAAAMPQGQLDTLASACRDAAVQLPLAAATDQRAMLQLLELEVLIGSTGIRVQLHAGALIGNDTTEPLCIDVPVKIARRGQELRLMYLAADTRPASKPDVKLLGLLAKAEAAYEDLQASTTLTSTARAHLARLAKLRFLAPDIITAIIGGRQPVTLTARTLLRETDLPMCWSAQCRTLGLF